MSNESDISNHDIPPSNGEGSTFDQVQTATKTGMHQYTRNVPRGQDGKVWYLVGARDANAAVELYFENCPRALSWSREQMMVPAELLSGIRNA